MKIWMRRTIAGLLVVELAPGALLVYALYRAHQRMDRRIDIPAYALEVPAAPSSTTAACVSRAPTSAPGRAVVTRGEDNLLLNPQHADFRKIVTGSPEPVVCDARLFARRRT
jgi:hypothetical protein